MKIAFKNFLTTLKRYKTASLLNIVGLTLAFVAFYVMMAQVTYDWGYNRSFPDADRIHAVVPQFFSDEYTIKSSSEVFRSVVEQCPEVERSGMLTRYYSESDVWVPRQAAEDRYSFQFDCMTPSAVDLLGMRAVEGNLHAFDAPDAVIMARSIAETMNVHAGDEVDISTWSYTGPGERRRYTVAGIYEDLADNSFLSTPCIFRSYDGMKFDDVCLFKLRKGASADNFAAQWVDATRERLIARYRGWHDENGDEVDVSSITIDVQFPSLHETYFDSRIRDIEHGSFTTMMTCAAIAVLVVIIAFINFVNFFFALIPVRLRAVNICKVFGASTLSLRTSFVFESLGFVSCALFITAWISLALPETQLAGYVSRPLSLGHNIPAVVLLVAIGVVMAVVSAVYPAYYITSFNASLAAKGRFSGSTSGRRLRVVLLGVQFCVSMVLITFSACMWFQYRYMVRYDIGIDRENLMRVELPWELVYRVGVVDEGMRSISGIRDVAYANAPMVYESANIRLGFERNGLEINLLIRSVTPNFPSLMGIPVIEGEGFKPEYAGSASKYCMISDATRRRYAFEMGETINDAVIVGFMRDFLGKPLDDDKGDVVYVADGLNGKRFVYFRTEPNTDIERVVRQVRDLIREQVPDADPEIGFFDSELEQLYSKTRRSAFVIGLFALLAVAISLMGVFGIVLFETQHRRREIAVRRVFGATTAELLRMFNRRYLIILCVCFAVAVPVSWYMADRWLTGFSRRLPLSWWLFAAAFVTVAALTLGLVTWRSYRAAGENPSRVLGGE